jgi:glycosyltransferase involved in cell wall biosynthesis
MRIAFLTPQFPSETSIGEGLGSYVYRIAKVLLESGHEPEVFVLSQHASQMSSYNGVLLHRVNWKKDQPLLHFLKGWFPSRSLRRSLELLLQARALSAALERRHAGAPFQIVQSADWLATGLLVRRNRGRLHIVRCSSAADLYGKIDGNVSIADYCRGCLERLSMKRAEIVYAPSHYLADYFYRTHKMDVRVVRPPRYLDVQALPSPTFPLPERFFVHFGLLIERKGTDLLAQALPLAWRRAPDLTMIWCGDPLNHSKLESWRSSWGKRANQVHITGRITKAEMYAVLQRADAAVLPSQIDNLPNTVIESLMFGIPVIGSRGASIDELVDEGENGHLVALGDVNGLAEELVRTWLGNSPVKKGYVWSSNIAREMEPERAAANLLELTKILDKN